MATPHTVHLLEASPPSPPRRQPALAALPATGRPSRRRWLKRGLSIGGIVFAGALSWATLFRPELTPVTVTRVGSGRVEETVTNSKAGTVRSRLHAELSTEIGGRVVSVPVRAGTRVRRGDVLVKLADEDWRAQLDLQQRTLAAVRAEERRACAVAAQSARELGRTRALAAEGIAAVSVLDRADSEHQTATAACEASRANVLREASAVRVAQVAVERTVLRAPFNGVVAEIRTELGEWITPAPPGIPVPPVVELIDPKGVYVSAALDEVDVAKVRLDLPVRITLDASPGQVFAGHVSRIAPYVLDQVDEGRTFEVEVTFDDRRAAESLTVGSSADVEIVLRGRDGVLRVPTDALVADRAVLVVSEGRLVERPVTIGLRNWDAVEILSGIAAGDPVVVSLDRAAVRAGARVRIESEVRR